MWVIDRFPCDYMINTNMIYTCEYLIDIPKYLIDADETGFIAAFVSTWSIQTRVALTIPLEYLIDKHEYLINTHVRSNWSIQTRVALTILLWVLDWYTWALDQYTCEFLIDSHVTTWLIQMWYTHVSTWSICKFVLDWYTWVLDRYWREWLIAWSIHMWVQNMRWRKIFQTIMIAWSCSVQYYWIHDVLSVQELQKSPICLGE